MMSEKKARWCKHCCKSVAVEKEIHETTHKDVVIHWHILVFACGHDDFSRSC